MFLAIYKTFYIYLLYFYIKTSPNTHDNWLSIRKSKAYDKHGEYSSQIQSFLKKNNIILDIFYDNLNLCSIEEAKIRFENSVKLKKQKENGKIFISDEEIDVMINKIINEC